MRKTTKLNANLIAGIILCIIGLVIGIAYINKYVPMDYTTTKGSALLAVWSVTGWMVSLLFWFWGLCKIVFDWFIIKYF